MARLKLCSFKTKRKPSSNRWRPAQDGKTCCKFQMVNVGLEGCTGPHLIGRHRAGQFERAFVAEIEPAGLQVWPAESQGRGVETVVNYRRTGYGGGYRNLLLRNSSS